MRPIVFSILFAGVAFAQLDSNIVTVTASREVNVPLDQASLIVSVDAGLDTTLDQVLAAIQAANITAANLSNVGPLEGTQVVNNTGTGAAGLATEWTFTLGVPLSSLPGTLTALTAAENALPNAANPMALGYYLAGVQSSPQAMAANPCPYPAVFADAETQAQKIAAAAGMSLGPLVAMTDGSQSSSHAATEATTYGYAFITGILGGPSSAQVVNFLSPPVVGSPPACSLVVHFQLNG